LFCWGIAGNGWRRQRLPVLKLGLMVESGADFSAPVLDAKNPAAMAMLFN
jgi:hypothetical protein